MSSPTSPPTRPGRQSKFVRPIGLIVIMSGVFLVEPVLAQSVGTAFCTSALADTIRNIFTVIQFGGPLIGGVLALGATVIIPMMRSVEQKRELKEIRNHGIMYGVILAPLGTVILQFILNNIVVGGTSCGF